MKQYLHRQAVRLEKAGINLAEALTGPIEQWSSN
jgi:hypothetical protein